MSEPEVTPPVQINPTTVKNMIVKRRKFLIVIAAFALLGGTLMSRSQAATYVVPLEAESGVRSGNIGPGSTQGASDGQSVVFGATAPTPTPPIPTPTPPTPNPSDPTVATCGASADTPSSPVSGYSIKKCEDFNGSSIPSGWSAYSGGGGSTVVGGGRKKEQCTVGSGILLQTQLSDGSTCGMSSNFAQKYGYWEVRMRAYSTGTSGSAPHPVLILWPDSEGYPEGGELDYFEASIGSKMQVFLHCASSSGGNCYSTSSDVDYSQWHTYGFEWTANGFTGFIDGKQFYTTTSSTAQPPGSMHQTIQLDNLSGKTPVKAGKMEVDWVHMYGK